MSPTSDSHQAVSASKELSVDPAWAWAPYVPSPDDPWDLRKVGHLFRRAAFGGNWAELQNALAEGPERTVARLTTPPEELGKFHQEYDSLLLEAARGAGQSGIRAWWLRRMMETPFPLEEKLLLFWQNHFAISADRVRDPTLFVDYLCRLREQAGEGSWQSVLGAVCGHPALLLSAGSPQNRKAQPSLRWARTFASHVGLGADALSVAELEEIARAWTGWFVINNRLRFIPSEHDPRPKTLLGQQGDFGIAELVRLLCSQPASQEFVARKLFRYFVSEEHSPSRELLAPLTERLAQGDSILAVVRVILRSNIFFSPLAYRSKVKSPVELVVGLSRQLAQTLPTSRLGEDLVDLGQDLCNPPTFDGWPDGRAWIHQLSYVRRKRVLRQLVAIPAVSPWTIAQTYGYGKVEKFPEFLTELLFQGDLPTETLAGIRERWKSLNAPQPPRLTEAAKTLLTDLLSLPEFELA